MSEPLPPPRLSSGDDRAFVRFDPDTGEILSHGHMRRDHIAAEAARGVAIIQLDVGHEPISTREHRVNLATQTIEPAPPEPRSERDRRVALDGLLREALRSSDHYMLDDALDNITAAERSAWRDYRRAIRDASAQPTLAEAIGALPKANPKGLDPFADFRLTQGIE